MCVCALTARARPDICPQPHSPDARDCLEIASMGSRCLRLQRGRGGDGRQRGVKVEGGEAPGSSLAIFGRFSDLSSGERCRRGLPVVLAKPSCPTLPRFSLFGSKSPSDLPRSPRSLHQERPREGKYPIPSALVALQGVPQPLGTAPGFTLLCFSAAARVTTPGRILCFPKASRNVAQAQCHIPRDPEVPGNTAEAQRVFFFFFHSHPWRPAETVDSPK